jgi:hypothetical protein
MDTPELLETELIALSPSRAADFKACPQLFKFRAIDRLPEPSDPSRARGTLVHAVLERLCRMPAAERTIGTARGLLGDVWAELKELDELAGLDLDAEEEASWLDEADRMIRNYFRLEDPAHVIVHDVEARVTHEGERTALRGIVDRIEVRDDGEWVLLRPQVLRPGVLAGLREDAAGAAPDPARPARGHHAAAERADAARAGTPARRAGHGHPAGPDDG